MRTERSRLSRHAATAQAIDYTLTRWPAFTRFLDDGRICLSNNAAERALRGIALGRRSWRCSPVPIEAVYAPPQCTGQSCGEGALCGFHGNSSCIATSGKVSNVP